MATYSRYERTTRTVEYKVPVNEPWGAAWTEVDRALRGAHKEYADTYGELPSDDSIRVHVSDDEVVISFEAKT